MKICLAVSLLSLGGAAIAFGQADSSGANGTGPSFIPDAIFKGSSLNGSQRVGQSAQPDHKSMAGQASGGS